MGVEALPAALKKELLAGLTDVQLKDELRARGCCVSLWYPEDIPDDSELELTEQEQGDFKAFCLGALQSAFEDLLAGYGNETLSELYAQRKVELLQEWRAQRPGANRP